MEPEVIPTANIVSFDDGNVDYNQRNISPYATPTVTFLIGPKRDKYTVMAGFLSECQEWMATLKSIIELPDVDEDIGHTLVHYLYTGKYELPGLHVWDGKLSKYQKSIRLYCVARKYGLGGLAKLAQNHTESVKKGKTKGISIFNVLDIAKEVYGKLPDDEVWFPSYLKQEINVAYENNGGLFTSEAFLKRFGGRKKLDKFLLKCVVEIYTDLLASATSPLEGVIEEQVLSCVKKAPSVEEPVFTDDVIVPIGPVPTDTPVCIKSAYNNLPNTEYVEVTGQAALSPTETVPLPAENKSLGSEDPWTAKKKKGKKGKKTSGVLVWDDVLPEPEILSTRPSVLVLDEPKQSDSDVPFKECVKMSLNDSRVETTLHSLPQAVDLPLQGEEEPIPLAVEAPLSFEDDWYYPSMGKKERKKAKKAKKDLASPVIETSSPSKNDWDFREFVSKKSEDRKEDQMTPASPTIETRLPPTDNGDSWDSGPRTPKYRKKEKVDLPSPKTESTFIPKEDWGVWGISVPKKDWKEETMDLPPPDCRIASPLEDDWGPFGASRKKTKKEKKKNNRALPRAPTPPSPSAECEEKIMTDATISSPPLASSMNQTLMTQAAVTSDPAVMIKLEVADG